MKTTTGGAGGRPVVMGRRGVVSTGHYLATECGLHVLRSGGNSVDAAAAAGFALTLLQPHQNGAGGEVPLLVYDAGDRRTHAVSGHGTAPREATLTRFRTLGVEVIPGDGFLPAVVPAIVGAWIRALERFGTWRLADVLEPAIWLAREGYPMYGALRDAIANAGTRFRDEWPTSAELYLPDGRLPALASVFRNPGWAATFGRLAHVDRAHRDRAGGLQAAHELFYGEIGRQIVGFARTTAIRDATGRSHTALLDAADFEAYTPRVEESVSVSVGGIQVHKCGPWTQGPVFLQALKLVEKTRAAEHGHNSAAYIHAVTECLKLALADRELHYGDPLFSDVPLDVLLSDAYAQERAGLVDPHHASLELRPGWAEGCGRIPPFEALDVRDVEAAVRRAGAGDTTKLEVIDAAGNMVSATTSGGWLQSSPVIPGLGFCLGTRAQMFCLEPRHPNCLAPGKRPRSTLTPTLATRDGLPFLSFGSPGGDQQDQWALQFFLNAVVFGMSLQEAVEAPTFWTTHAPGSFYPRTAEPGTLYLEERVEPTVRAELASLGHRVVVAPAWSGGNTLAACIDTGSGVLSAAASPRLEPAYAAAY